MFLRYAHISQSPFIHLHTVVKFIYHALQVAYLVLSLVQKLFLEAFLLKQQESFAAKTQKYFLSLT